jgi:hypothetical protein
MCPVAYDAFSTGISGRTFAKPMGSTPPGASSLTVRGKRLSTNGVRAPSARATVRGAGQGLAAGASELTQIAEVSVPAPIAGCEIGRKPHGVVVSVEQLVDEQRELLGQFH